MRSLFLMALLLPCQLIAAELISEPHAMLYYRMALGGGGAKQQGHSFGLRLDRASFNTGETLDQSALFQQQAVFDFKMSPRGIDGIYLSGNNLLENYYLNNADEDGSKGEDRVTSTIKTIAIVGGVTLVLISLILSDTIDDILDDLEE